MFWEALRVNPIYFREEGSILKKSWKRLICSVSLAAAVFVAGSGCGGKQENFMNENKDNTISAPRLGTIADNVMTLNDGEMPIGTWAPVGDVEHISAETYEDIRAAGYNFGIGEVESTDEQKLRSLRYAADNDISLWLVDGTILGLNRVSNRDEIKTVAEMETALRGLSGDYMNESNFLGHLAIDEPGKLQIEALINFSEAYANVFGEKGFVSYTNLFPDYASISQLGFREWSEYLAYFAESNPEFMSYDYYPYSYVGAENIYGLIQSLAVAQEVNQPLNIPVWATTQTVEFPKNQMVMTQAKALQQNYINLAMGAKGITGWLYGIPSHHEWDRAMVNRKGEKTYIYDLVKNANLEIKELAKTMLTLDYQDVILLESAFSKYPAYATSMDDYAKREGSLLVGAEGDGIMISVLKNSYGDLKYFVVNTSIEESSTVKLTFAGSVTAVHAWEAGVRNAYSAKDYKKMKLELPAGAGVLLEPVTAA